MATEARSVEQATIADRFQATRALTRAIAAPLSDADATIQPSPEASPVKWHLAHTTWFFETFVLRDHVPGYAPQDPRWGFLFNSYYDGEGARHARDRRGMLSRPALSEVLDYRARIDEALLEVVPSLPPAAAALVELGINHEQQHQELMLTDILAAFAENPIAPALWAPRRSPAPVAAPSTRKTGFAGGIWEIGHDGDGFAFDCEGPRHEVLLRPYELEDAPVTNRAWIAFIEDGGYRKPGLWTADGWAWVQANGIEAPLYWSRSADGSWQRFGLDGVGRIDEAAPVAHVSWYEADAFARWAEARLPTEAEWEIGAASLDPDGGNQLDEAGPVAPRAAPARRLGQMFGDVWEWTSSPFTPYPGFRPPEGTVGEYNGKFMVNQFVLRGGSCATPRGHMRASYRNFFYPHQRWQFCGLRLARDA